MTARLAPATLLLVSLLTVACGTGTTTTAGEPSATPSTELERAEERWADMGPPAYEMTLVSSCGERSGLGIFDVTVTAEGTDVDPHPGSDMSDVLTVRDLFAYVDETTREGAEVVDVTYDATFGYPVSIDVDYTVAAIDDEACYQVKEFTPLGIE